MLTPPFARSFRIAGLLAVTTSCTAKPERPASDTAAAPAVAPSPAMSPMATSDTAMAGMAAMTGNADQDFLRMMSDHHKGLIAIAHLAKDRKGTSPTIADGRKLDAQQDAELDRMTTMLEQDFKDPYAPKVAPEHKAMHDDLQAKSGTEFDRTFYQNVIAHHEQALKMIADYLPKAGSQAIRQMAEKMKADQTREIGEFRQKLAKLGA